MPYSFEATEDYFNSERKVQTLISFAQEEGGKGNEENRMLFLKLGVVFLVTRFQVYVENVLKEFDYKLKQTNKFHGQLPLHLRLYAIKNLSEKRPLQKELENPLSYNPQKLQNIQTLITLLGDLCNDSLVIHEELKIDTQFPLGKQGLTELKNLFRQVEGLDIFENANFDIDKLNEILWRRHNIIHEDANIQITEITVEDYKVFVSEVVVYIDGYLGRIIKPQ